MLPQARFFQLAKIELNLSNPCNYACNALNSGPNFINEMKIVKGVVHFKKKTFADTPMSSKISMSFFLQSKRN